jgi:16S rRNA (guanine(966)-N(2))-methyltransferase RsmD
MKIKEISNFKSVHIMAGKYKNKKIFLPDTPLTRPSKSIVRESIFNTLQNDIFDKTFIEMFAGSGSIGFEALSRGASEIIFMEKEKIPFDVLKQNSKNFPNEDIKIIFGDSLINISNVLKEAEYQIILYLDPPFSIRENMENIYIDLFKTLDDLELSDKIELIILEHLSSEKAPEKIAQKEFSKTKKFGKTTISYYI